MLVGLTLDGPVGTQPASLHPSNGPAVEDSQKHRAHHGVHQQAHLICDMSRGMRHQPCKHFEKKKRAYVACIRPSTLNNRNGLGRDSGVGCFCCSTKLWRYLFLVYPPPLHCRDARGLWSYDYGYAGISTSCRSWDIVEGKRSFVWCTIPLIHSTNLKLLQ